MLFATFGVNIESVTVIVSIFMFGLGIGALAGGVLSKRYPLWLPHIFMICEFFIGLFGLASIPLITYVGYISRHFDLLGISLTTFALLFFPTLLMGSTLPILVAYLHAHYKNVGRSVSLLYCVNTLGAAVACFITADLLFAFWGQQRAVTIAAMLNFSVGVLVFIYTRGMGRKPVSTPGI